MKMFLGLLFISSLTTSWNCALAEEPVSTAKEANISSVQLKAIESAEMRLRRLRPQWDSYNRDVVETAASWEVTFWQPNDRSVLLLETGRLDADTPMAEMPILHNAVIVIMDKQTFKVESVHYRR
jgi:hypothetical protein